MAGISGRRSCGCVGPAAGPKLVSVANGVIAAPGQDKTKNRIGDELLLGLAATGSPEAVKDVLDLAKLDRGDATLGWRSLAALYKAYVDPDGLFAVADPEALVPNLPTIVEIAKDDTQDVRASNDAVSADPCRGAAALSAAVDRDGRRTASQRGFQGHRREQRAQVRRRTGDRRRGPGAAGRRDRTSEQEPVGGWSSTSRS